MGAVRATRVCSIAAGASMSDVNRTARDPALSAGFPIGRRRAHQVLERRVRKPIDLTRLRQQRSTPNQKEKST